MSIVEEVRPLYYELEVQQNPLSENPSDKVLVVILPAASPPRSYIFALTDDQKARLHDGTAPTTLTIARASDIPPPPE